MPKMVLLNNQLILIRNFLRWNLREKGRMNIYCHKERHHSVVFLPNIHHGENDAYMR
jgi:hypothetical protein